MNHANVETFIVFRSLTPLFVALAYSTFRRQPCPSKLTFMSLLIILGETVYIKHMVMNLGLITWEFVL
ncbi:hypothetical protein GOBAR_DD24539 [Gossypium barbadense]|nr:hypothetical protein GOBAR_DD24539 [Gossypium barbadense]